MLAVMLLTAINYQNSLIYLITFFLGSVFVLSIWLCFLNMVGLVVTGESSGRAFQGKPLPFNCKLSRINGLPIGLKLGETSKVALSVSHIIDQDDTCTIQCQPKVRGRHELPSLYLESRYPFGLILAWSWPKVAIESLVYPMPLRADQIVSGFNDGVTNDISLPSFDYNDIREFQTGDSLNRILWKKLASNDQLVVRESDNIVVNPEWLDWDNYEGDLENRLSQLCYEVCRFSNVGASFGLRLPGIEIMPASGKEHTRVCLDNLALFS